MSTHAELSSAATVLDELRARIATIADGLTGTERESLADGLFEVERQLGNAHRRLARLVGTSS